MRQPGAAPKKPGKEKDFASLIRTDREYMEHPFSRSEKASYVYEIKKGNKQLVFFGASHSNKMDDPQFDEIEKAFKEAAPQKVYIEGFSAINHARKEDIAASVSSSTLEDEKKFGESHFTLKLAVDADADLESPEPNFIEELSNLEHKGYSKWDIFSYYMYRDTAQYQRNNPQVSKEDFERYLQPFIDSFAHAAIMWSASEIEKMKDRFFSELELGNIQKYREAVDPIPWPENKQDVTNEIARASSQFRETYMLQRFAEGLKTHDRLFIVYGSGHALRLEPALQALMNE